MLPQLILSEEATILDIWNGTIKLPKKSTLSLIGLNENI